MNTRRRPMAPVQSTYAINAKICRLVAEHPCLYDRSNEFYMRQSSVNKAWKDISKKTQSSIQSCKERWRNIRTSYARSIKLHHGENTYYLNNELLFLQNHITPGVPIPVKGRRSKARRQEESGHNCESPDPFNPLVDIKTSPSSVDSEHAPSQDSQENPESEEESDDETDSFRLRDQKRLRLSSESKEDEMTSPAPHIDFDDVFLKGLLPEMKVMDFYQKLYFKRRVYEVLSEIFGREDPHISILQHQSCPRRQPRPEMGEKANETTRLRRQPPPQAPSNPLQRLGVTLQLPKLMPKPSKTADDG
ncbi:uncharacterized protein [Drosophila bipectinata]|uniref:uncharacterized protein isoform X1 n=1 Tax=Drosophila bipectinata TaxID=42026 RepID=UPI001C89100A|nr:uncharacterized protein LOC108133905 [Drosophila bipectinata]